MTGARGGRLIVWSDEMEVRVEKVISRDQEMITHISLRTSRCAARHTTAEHASAVTRFGTEVQVRRAQGTGDQRLSVIRDDNNYNGHTQSIPRAHRPSSPGEKQTMVRKAQKHSAGVLQGSPWCEHEGKHKRDLRRRHHQRILKREWERLYEGVSRSAQRRRARPRTCDSMSGAFGGLKGTLAADTVPFNSQNGF